ATAAMAAAMTAAVTAAACGPRSGAWAVDAIDAPCGGLSTDLRFELEHHGGRGYALRLDPGAVWPDEGTELWCERAHGWVACDGWNTFDLDQVGLDASGEAYTEVDAELTSAWTMAGTVSTAYDCRGDDCPTIDALGSGDCGPVAFEASVD
ncbi:MAG: hypothetical protein ABMB14_32015, partial [Myxococcota bacterium]